MTDACSVCCPQPFACYRTATPRDPGGAALRLPTVTAHLAKNHKEVLALYTWFLGRILFCFLSSTCLLALTIHRFLSDARC